MSECLTLTYRKRTHISLDVGPENEKRVVFKICFVEFFILSSEVLPDEDRKTVKKGGGEDVAQAMRPKARGLPQHGGPPGWLEESVPTECDFVFAGRSMPLALTDHTTCPRSRAHLLLNVHKRPS
jgi:hypothetical protein